MKTLRSLFAVAIAVFATSLACAQQGPTHDHPLDDETAYRYIDEFTGHKFINGYWKTKDNNTTWPPLEVGNVIFIQVNDYWKATTATSCADLFNVTRYGVKSIDLVTQSAPIGSGMLYHHDATTNRFFFAIRSTNLDNTSPSVANPFRWYNEFSTSTSDSDTYNDLKASYDALKDGDFMKAPHSCVNSLYKNHFTTLYDKETTDQTYTISAMLYVPTDANATTVKKNAKYSENGTPRIFLYVNKLNGERIASTDNLDCKYAADLNWATSFDKAKNNNFGFVAWDNKSGGIKEESKIYRKIEGLDGYDSFELVAEGLVDLKTWTDQTLPTPDEDGYNVEYYVVTTAITYDANNERLGKDMGSALTNHITLFIPGESPVFELKITNNFSSKFTPVADKAHQSYNDIKNTIVATKTENTPALNTYKAGDKFELINTDASNNSSAVKTVTIKAINGSRWTFEENGKESTATISTEQDLLNVVATHTDELQSKPGKDYDAQYQLVYTPVEGATLKSNTVTSKGMHTKVEVSPIYRSGTPDPTNNAEEELYAVHVRFEPIMDNNVAHYHIWQNGKEPIIRIAQSGTTFTLVGKDANGNFNIPMGNIEPEADGYISYRTDASIKAKANATELKATGLSDDDLFYTVEVCTTGSNSYGNFDEGSNFKGNENELVYNAKAHIYALEGDNKNGMYRAEITWTKPENLKIDDDDYVLDEPDYYTVHRYMVNSDNTFEYEPLTKYYKGHEEPAEHPDTHEVEDAGFTVAGETKDGSAIKFTPELISKLDKEWWATGFKVIDCLSVPGFKPSNGIEFPAMYYVKAHYENAVADKMTRSTFMSDKRNYIEKNSNPTTVLSPTITAVEDLNVSEVVSVKYYNLMGIEIMNPAAGEIVVARKQYANGIVSSKVIKK